MTHFLVSDEHPEGHKLEDILSAIRADVIKRADKIALDPRAEAQHVLNNNMRVLQLLTEAIELARDSSRTLDKAFGPHVKGGPPRIGSL
jgi:DNA gyrase/topoisomerase IV subunit A